MGLKNLTIPVSALPAYADASQNYNRFQWPWERSGERRWRAGALVVSVLCAGIMMNHWDTNATAPLATHLLHLSRISDRVREHDWSHPLGRPEHCLCARHIPPRSPIYDHTLPQGNKRKDTQNRQTPKQAGWLPLLSLRNLTNVFSSLLLKFQKWKVLNLLDPGGGDKGWFFFQCSSLPRFLLLIPRNHLHQAANEFGHGSPHTRKPLEVVTQGVI